MQPPQNCENGYGVPEKRRDQVRSGLIDKSACGPRPQTGQTQMKKNVLCLIVTSYCLTGYLRIGECVLGKRREECRVNNHNDDLMIV